MDAGRPLHWKNAWITGASTGIGRALALMLAERGVRVAASARSADKLGELAGQASRIAPFPLDVVRRDDVAVTYADIVAQLGAVDLAVLNAGIWQPMKARDFDAGIIAQSLAVNVVGVANPLEHLIPAMIQRGAGHIAIVASVAGYRGLPKALAYAPTKAALINMTEALQVELSRHGITVSLINPGFVETPMTAVNRFPMPFMVSVDDAAARIIRGLERGKFEIAFPWQLVGLLKLLRILPNRLYLKIAARL
jgi:short-subunit dehydrogenase